MKTKISREQKTYFTVGRISFLIGLVIAIAIALFSAPIVPAWSVYVLGALGIIVGLINVAEEEVKTFLIASIAFILSFQTLSTILSELTFGWVGVPTFLALINVFIAPAAAIVAIKALFTVARDWIALLFYFIIWMI